VAFVAPKCVLVNHVLNCELIKKVVIIIVMQVDVNLTFGHSIFGDI
jgi:hypothetical protein